MIEIMAKSTIKANAMAALIEPSGSAKAWVESLRSNLAKSVEMSANAPNKIMIPKIARIGNPTAGIASILSMP